MNPAAAGGGVRDSDRAGQAVVTITDHPCRRSRDHLDPVVELGLDCDAALGTSPLLDGALSRGAGSGFASDSLQSGALSHAFLLLLVQAHP